MIFFSLLLFRRGNTSITRDIKLEKKEVCSKKKLIYNKLFLRSPHILSHRTTLIMYVRSRNYGVNCYKVSSLLAE